MTDENKRQPLRQVIGDKRSGLSSLEVQNCSHQIVRKLKELEPIRKAHVIMGFASIRNEIDLRTFMMEEIQIGKTILLPRIERDGTMAAVELKDWHSTHPGQFGILEPDGAAFPLCDIDAVIVPGLVFDASGYRLGYGKGYYDRFLPQLTKNAFICGVGYDFQVVDTVYPHPGDIPMHWIVTEKSEVVIDWNFF